MIADDEIQVTRIDRLTGAEGTVTLGEAVEILADRLRGDPDAVRAWLLGGGELSTVGFIYRIEQERTVTP